MTTYKINPLEDTRWAEFVERHPRASVFHTTGWLRGLHRTYGYEPVVFTTSPPGATLTNGIAFCRIRSWLIGCRLVSLPFSDHCDPLVESPADCKEIFSSLHRSLNEERLKYIEVRPLRSGLIEEFSMERSNLFNIHTLDLRPPLERLFRAFQKDSIQRKIRRAEREGLGYEEGNSEGLLSKFFRLFLLTRRRHNLPPQPVEWFRNLIASLRNQLTIRVAVHGGVPIASILTLSHRNTLVYKYGCSDARYHHLGGMPFLFWKAIQESKEQGLYTLDFGRSDAANEGLNRFKDQFGAARSTLTYGRICVSHARRVDEGFLMQVAKPIFAHMPNVVLTAAGRLLYRHIA